VFLGITSDRHWQRFCDQFDRPDLAADDSLATNNQRIDARPRLMPVITRMIAELSLAAVTDRALAASLPFAHVARPEQLFDDPHLNAGGYLLDTVMPDGTTAKLPALPLSLGGRTADLRNSPPQLGADTEICLASLGFTAAEIRQFDDDGVIFIAAAPDR
jgi:crotonobetainyl-CoA:carnitine CoA-transferase CaiB-like acyl-CoA transferase